MQKTIFSEAYANCQQCTGPQQRKEIAQRCLYKWKWEQLLLLIVWEELRRRMQWNKVAGVQARQETLTKSPKNPKSQIPRKGLLEWRHERYCDGECSETKWIECRQDKETLTKDNDANSARLNWGQNNTTLTIWINWCCSAKGPCSL